MIYGRYDFDQKHFNKESEEDWGRLKQYMHETRTMEAMNEMIALSSASPLMGFKTTMETDMKTLAIYAVALELVFVIALAIEIYIL